MAKKWSLKYEILYAGETVYKDISSIAMSRNLSISRYMCGSSFKSAISTANISLTRGTATRYALQQEVFTKLMEAKLAHEMVYFRIYDISIASYIFKGVVDTGNLSMSAGVKPDEFSIEVENFLKLLDDDIETHVEFPLGDIENEGEIAEGAYVFNGSDPANSLIIKLLLLRGFSVSDIDLANSYQILDRIPRFVYDPDKKKTYRNRIDTILYEYNAVLDQTDSGKFIIRPMKFDSPVASRTVAYQIENKMKLSGGDNQNDGIKLTWSELALMKNATVYQASVTPTYDADGVVLDEGEKVEPLGYWPATGDIEDIYYEFKADFLDREYYTSQSRLKNEDLSLIAVKDMQYELMADDDIVEVEEQREVYPLKAKILFYDQNSTDAQYIRLFNVLGTALYRKKNNTPVYPSTAKKTYEYVSEYIFNKQAADAFGSNQVLLTSYGDNKYSWTETGARVQVGTIVNARVKNSSISAIVLVTSVKWSLVNTETWKNEVSAIGISAFNALVSKDSSSVPGRGPVDGTPGQTTKTVIQYALGDTTGPIEVPDYVIGQKTGEVIDWELGTESYLIGEEEWTYTIPVPAEGEYVWMRIGFYNPATENWPTSWEYTRITGDIGPQGPQGTGVSLVTEYYLATDLDTGVTTETAGWNTTMQPLTLVNKYLWNYEKITFSDESSQNTIPVIIGVYGDTGRSINAITEYYLATSEATGITRETAGWTPTMQTTTPTNKYLWNYEKIDWSAGTTPTYVDPMIIGVHGETGESALGIDVIASASVIPTTSRGVPKIASVKYTALLKNITISLASDIDWTCSDPEVTLYPVEGDIYSVNILTTEVSTDSFYVIATIGPIFGQTSTGVSADGKPAPMKLPMETAHTPTETPDGEPLVAGDYFVVGAEFTEESVTYEIGTLWEYTGTSWELSTDKMKALNAMGDFEEIAEEADDGVFCRVVAKEIYAQSAVIEEIGTKTITVKEDGSVGSEDFTEDTEGIPTSGYMLDNPLTPTGRRGRVRSHGGIFNNATIYGTILHPSLITRAAAPESAIVFPSKTAWNRNDFWTALSVTENTADMIAADLNIAGNAYAYIRKITSTTFEKLIVAYARYNVTSLESNEYYTSFGKGQIRVNAATNYGFFYDGSNAYYAGAYIEVFIDGVKVATLFSGTNGTTYHEVLLSVNKNSSIRIKRIAEANYSYQGTLWSEYGINWRGIQNSLQYSNVTTSWDTIEGMASDYLARSRWYCSTPITFDSDNQIAYALANTFISGFSSLPEGVEIEADELTSIVTYGALNDEPVLSVINYVSSIRLNYSGGYVTFVAGSDADGSFTGWYNASASVAVLSKEGIVVSNIIPKDDTREIGEFDNPFKKGFFEELFLGTASLATNGYCSLPNGMLMQWGQATVSVNGTSVSFPVSFATALLSVTLATRVNTSSAVTVVSTSKTGMTLQKYTADGDYGAFWMAIGY